MQQTRETKAVKTNSLSLTAPLSKTKGSAAVSACPAGELSPTHDSILEGQPAFWQDSLHGQIDWNRTNTYTKQIVWCWSMPHEACGESTAWLPRVFFSGCRSPIERWLFVNLAVCSWVLGLPSFHSLVISGCPRFTASLHIVLSHWLFMPQVPPRIKASNTKAYKSATSELLTKYLATQCKAVWDKGISQTTCKTGVWHTFVGWAILQYSNQGCWRSGPSQDGKGKGGRCNVFGMCILYIYIYWVYLYVIFLRGCKSIWYICSHLEIQRQHISGMLGLRVEGSGRTAHIIAHLMCVCVCYVSLSMALSSGCKGNGPTPLYHRGFLPIKTTSYWRVHTSMKSLWVGQNVALRPWTLETVRNLSLGQMSVAVAFPHPARTGENASWYFLFNMFRPKPWITLDTQTIGIWSIVLKTSKSRLSVTPSHGSFSHLIRKVKPRADDYSIERLLQRYHTFSKSIGKSKNSLCSAQNWSRSAMGLGIAKPLRFGVHRKKYSSDFRIRYCNLNICIYIMSNNTHSLQ